MGIDGRATRLLELREAIEDESTRLAPQVMLESSEGDKLAVRSLDLVTPKDVCLAAGLTFEVKRGAPLLVTGPNGCGKTALARVLLELWPGAGIGAALAMPPDLLIVPQKPYLCPGTFGDQVTYPKNFAQGEDEEKVEAAVRAVGIGYLIDRFWGTGGWQHRTKFEEVLSGGEQQRLTLSRALFHQPAFALLDECTSMVAADAEEQLYRTAIKDFGITPLTFSQRLFLADLHSNELRLGDNSEAGWALEAVGTRSDPEQPS